MRIIIPLLLSILTMSYCFATNATINSENWKNHPKIKRIRVLYNEIEHAVMKPTSIGCDTEDYNFTRTIYEDSTGVIRKYKLSGGTGDSAGDATYYYDKTGKLRFAFQVLRAVNGTHMETRTYFDRKESVLYQDEQLLDGPGWCCGFSEFIKDPRRDFNSSCN